MKKHSILIVEDSLTQLEFLKQVFLNKGHDVFIASNGIDALEEIKKQCPSIVISDISMPVMDGYELCRSIKNNELLNKLPVILLTGLSDPEEILKSIQAGADCYMTKPCDDQLLLSKIDDLIANNKNLCINAPHTAMNFAYKGKQYIPCSGKKLLKSNLANTYKH